MTFREYVAIDAHNWSSIKRIEESPLAYYHAKHVAEREETAAFRIGRATHALVLEGEVAFKAQFWKRETFIGKGAVKARQALEARAEAAGVTLLSEDEWTAAHGAAASVLTNPWALALLKRGVSEHVIQWTDAETQLKCKARVDFAGRALVDLKTALRIEPRVFAANAVRLGYPGQFAFYEVGCVANEIPFEDMPHMIVVQSVMPHDVLVYRMSPPVMEHGRRRMRRCLRILSECLDADYWPGAGAGGPVDFELPRWADDVGGWALTDSSNEAEGEMP